MSQHDLAIDNGPGMAVRTDMIAALQALVTLSSGPLEPATMFAGMWWLDTSVTPNGSLKMRNLSNTAWTFPSIYGDDRVGEIAYYARSVPPAGWLKANGAIVSRTTYAALFAAIGTQFGVGDGTNTFGLPDLRGRFVRAWDDGASIDPSRAFGSTQVDAVKDHDHTATTSIVAGGSHAHGGTANSGGSHTHTGSTTSDSHSHTLPARVEAQEGGADNARVSLANTGGAATSIATPSDAHSHTLTINSGGSHTHTITSDTEPAHTHTATTTVATGGGGTETRPTNVAMLACIRYA